MLLLRISLGFLIVTNLLWTCECSRILVIPSPGTSSWTRLTNISLTLAHNGHQVDLLDFNSEFSQKAIFPVKLRQGLLSEADDSVHKSCSRILKEREAWMSNVASAGWDLVIVSVHYNPCGDIMSRRSASRVLLFSDTYLSAINALYIGSPLSLINARWWQDTNSPLSNIFMAGFYISELVSSSIIALYDRLMLGSGVGDMTHGEVTMLIDYTPVLDWPYRSLPPTAVYVGGLECPSTILAPSDDLRKTVESQSTSRGIILVDIALDDDMAKDLGSVLNLMKEYTVIWYVDDSITLGPLKLDNHVIVVNQPNQLHSLLSNSKTVMMISDITQPKAMRSLCAKVAIMGVAMDNSQQGLLYRYIHHKLAISRLQIDGEAQEMATEIRKAARIAQTLQQKQLLKELKAEMSDSIQSPTEISLFHIQHTLRHGNINKRMLRPESIPFLSILIFIGLLICHLFSKFISFTFSFCRTSNKKDKKIKKN